MEEMFNPYEIGDVVFLNSDLERKIPMTVAAVGKYKVRVCTHDNKNKRLFKTEEIDIRLLTSQIEKELVMQNFDVLYASSIDVYGLKCYSSLIGLSFAGAKEGDPVHDKDAERDTHFVYDFKKKETRKDLIKKHLQILKAYLGADTICAIPPHIPNSLNSLQKMFGATINRVELTEPRKYDHKNDLKQNYEQTYEIDWSNLTGKILLIDDVCTSGATLVHFANKLQYNGFEVVKMALGIDHKLNPQKHTLLTYFE